MISMKRKMINRKLIVEQIKEKLINRRNKERKRESIVRNKI